MASNITLVGAFMWLVFGALILATDLAHEFAWVLKLLGIIQVLLVLSLFAVVRKLKQWPGTPRIAYYQFSLALGSLPIVISLAYFISRSLPH